mgnify:CR=1 FL=1
MPALITGRPVAAAALKTLEDLGTRPWHVARMESRWWLWKATNDRAHLMESWRLLRHLRDHAPEENRVTVIANVPLHRELMVDAKFVEGGTSIHYLEEKLAKQNRPD